MQRYQYWFIIILSILSQLSDATKVLGIAGDIYCHGKPVDRQRVDIFEPTRLFDAFFIIVTESALNHGWTESIGNGSFKFDWGNGKEMNYAPIVLIDHRCGQIEVLKIDFPTKN